MKIVISQATLVIRVAYQHFFVLTASLFITAGLASAPNSARAEFPDRPITLVVPSGPGSAIDAVARSLAQGAQKRLGQNVIVDNRPGAGNALGPIYVGKRPADGYTIGIVSNNPFVLAHFFNTLQMDPVTDFTHIITTTGYLMAVAVRADSKIKDINELLEAARRQPGRLTYSTSGTASTGFLNMEEFSALAKIKAQHVPYKSGAEAVTAVLAGHVDFFSDAAWAPFAQDGRLRPLLIFANKRSSRYPDIPVPADIVSARISPGELLLIAPKGLPPAVLQKLHDAFKEASNAPEYLNILEKFNLEPMYKSPDETRDSIAASIPPLRKMFDTLGLGKQ